MKFNLDVPTTCPLTPKPFAKPTIEAQGKVEHVTNTKTGEQYYRLLIGNKPTDNMFETTNK